MELKRLLKQYIDGNELTEYLKKNPVPKNIAKQLILDSDNPQRVKTQMLGEMDGLFDEGVLGDDYIESFEDFSVRARKEGKYPVKTSVMKVMDKDEFTQANQKQMAFYPDMPMNQDVQHYEYEMTDGTHHKTGKGQSVTYAKCYDKKLIEKKATEYGRAKQEIKKILIDMDVNGADYNDWMVDKSKADSE